MKRTGLMLEFMYDRFREMSYETLDSGEDMWILREFANRSKHITEFGIRWGNSSICLLSAEPEKLVSYDIVATPQEAQIRNWMPDCPNTTWEVRIEDLTTLETIEETDFLFIDDLHTFKQVDRELRQFSPFVRKYIAVHDTIYLRDYDQFGEKPGLMKAVTDFTRDHDDWFVAVQSFTKCGLTVLERKDAAANPGEVCKPAAV